jgi:REP element-mobilizing transposase RayT
MFVEKPFWTSVLQHRPVIDVIKLSVQIDRVHMVIVVLPRIAVADVVQYIKSQSAKKL